MKISLDNVKMNVVQTAENGVVNHETIFSFEQNRQQVFAKYEGGKIIRGNLVGTLIDNKLKFTYCQIQHDDTLDHGSSECELKINDEGKIQLIEHFEWATRPGEKGINIFEEL